MVTSIDFIPVNLTVPDFLKSPVVFRGHILSPRETEALVQLLQGASLDDCKRLAVSAQPPE